MTPPVSLLDFLAQKKRTLSPLLIVMHDYPDPDAMASAYALSFLAQTLCGIASRLVYGGSINRVENKEMARLLKIPIHPSRERDWKQCQATALVDTQPPFKNNVFPSKSKPALVIDHHRRNKKTSADLVVIDESYGATSTILADALFLSKLAVPKELATALVYGIGSETQNLAREASQRDIAAYLTLFPLCHIRLLGKIQNPPRPLSFFSVLHQALGRTFVCKSLIGAHLGPIPNPEIVAEIADLLVMYEKAHWSICTGRFQGKLHISLRTKNPSAQAGRLLEKIIGGKNRAGGHGMIAGGSMEINENAPKTLWQTSESRLTQALCKALGFPTNTFLNYPLQK